MRSSTNTTTRTTLGFAAVIAVAIAIMPLLVETGPATADIVPAARQTSHSLEIAALR
jgi:hypothetical protein